MPRRKGIKEFKKRLQRRRVFKEVKCASPECNNTIIVMTVTGKSLCEDCFREQMNIYRRGEKPVIATARGTAGS